jgi:hypothetical protein
MELTEATLSPSQHNAAALRAEANWNANAEALRSTQPRLGDSAGGHTFDIEWIFARDASLTAMEPGDRWWAGCSLPHRAAEFMLKDMTIASVSSCFLTPVHAAQLRVALDRLERQQTVIAIVPEPRALDVLLHCHDFSGDINSHRLWFVSGETWEADLEKLFFDNPGLPTPSEFIRPILANPDAADGLIGPAQKVFAGVSAARAEAIQSLVSGWSRRTGPVRKVCVVAPSRFRLWDDAGIILGELAGESELADANIDICRFDSDDPISASPFALAVSLADCDALVAPNMGRADLPGIVADGFPWITWVTTPRMPAAQRAGERDRLIVADPAWRSLAEQAGWSPEQIDVATWPGHPAPAPAVKLVCILADTRPTEAPASVKDYSSQVLLWDFIREELTQDPFALTGDVDQYLKSRRSRFQVPETSFDVVTFIDRLIVPAYQQGIARLLVREGIPLRLFGHGWDSVEPLAALNRGPVTSREQLRQIVAASSALIHVWPTKHLHPIELTGRPVVRAHGRTAQSFLRDTRRALEGTASPAVGQNVSELGSSSLLQVLKKL